MSSQEPRLRITGRSSSHFTRTARMVARELGLRVELEVRGDIMSSTPRTTAVTLP
jgi:hypothetical protein